MKQFIVISKKHFDFYYFLRLALQDKNYFQKKKKKIRLLKAN